MRPMRERPGLWAIPVCSDLVKLLNCIFLNSFNKFVHICKVKIVKMKRMAYRILQLRLQFADILLSGIYEELD